MKKTLYPDSRPWTRWWWFCQPISGADVQAQLTWLADNGFGGVEIAWIYPLKGREPGPRWLSQQWSAAVADAKSRAGKLGLGCDFTFGTLWPFGGSIVPESDASRTINGISKQRIRISWEAPHAKPGYVLNHLDAGALQRYSEKMGSALKPAMAGRPSGLFCDSWEVAVEGLWADGFGAEFRQRFGYDVEPLMDSIDSDPDARYDYRKLLSEFVIREFYAPFTAISRDLGGFSRVQCHGAPADLVSAYAAVDVPESEAILFDPPFSALAASAAAISGANVVSAETFTCLYGWISYPGPGPHQGSEFVGDLKLLADAMFANGVNFIIWHGMPYNAQGGSDRFYASVEVGPGSSMAAQFKPFNGYMEQVSAAMRRGKTVSPLAVYLPLEDAWMSGELPEEKKRPSAAHHWELQYARFPEETRAFAPLWVTGSILEDARVEGGKLCCGDSCFDGLYADCEWMDRAALSKLLEIARSGLPVCLKQAPREPGKVKTTGYQAMVTELRGQSSVTDDLSELRGVEPLVVCSGLPEFWCRQDGGTRLFFFAHPSSRGLKYPMEYGQSRRAGHGNRRAVLRTTAGVGAAANLEFAPHASILLELGADGGVKDITPRFEVR